jgi:hypothetical protein
MNRRTTSALRKPPGDARARRSPSNLSRLSPCSPCLRDLRVEGGLSIRGLRRALANPRLAKTPKPRHSGLDPESRAVGWVGAKRKPGIRGIRRALADPRPAKTPKPRHCRLNPESGSSIRFFEAAPSPPPLPRKGGGVVICGASRRRKRFWIPDRVRNDDSFLRLQPFLRFAGRASCLRQVKPARRADWNDGRFPCFAGRIPSPRPAKSSKACPSYCFFSVISVRSVLSVLKAVLPFPIFHLDAPGDFGENGGCALGGSIAVSTFIGPVPGRDAAWITHAN